MTTLRLPYKTVNGVDIPTDIHLPTTLKRDLAPVIIIIHGGGFMLGSSSMNNRDQIEDCLQREWIVLSIDHRLCPGVNLLEGPMTDVRDCLEWVQNGGLRSALASETDGTIKPDPERVMAMGTSAGGHLALSLAWNTPKPPLAILDFYGAKNFSSPSFHQPITQIQSKLPPTPPPSFFAHLYTEKETFQGGVSLEGQQSPAGPDLTDPRQAFVLHNIANGTTIPAIWPNTPKDHELIDPILNVHAAWPPTAFVHGTEDFMIPMSISKDMERELKGVGVETAFFEVEGEHHTFVGKMVKGSKTWETQRKGFEFLERVLERSYTSGT